MAEREIEISAYVPARVVGAICGLAGFVVAVIAGTAAGNDAASVLGTAIVGLVACQLVGTLVGLAGERALREQVETGRSEDPAAAQDQGSDSVRVRAHGMGEAVSTDGG